MNLFAFIHDIVDDHRAIADKFCVEHRLAFFERFCEWKSVGGELDWHPKYGWGVDMRNWVRKYLESQMTDTFTARSIIGCLLAEWDAKNEEEEVMESMRTTLSIDFPKGPPTNAD